MKERKELLKKYDKKFWLIPLGVFLIPILFEFAYRDPLFDASVKLIVKIQDKLGNLKFVQKYSFLFHVINVITSNFTYIFITLLSYNFINGYKCFILMLSIFFSNYLSSLLALIYRCPRPYMVNAHLVPYLQFSDWGYPDNRLMTLVAFYSSFFSVFFKAKKTKKIFSAKLVLGITFGLYGAFIVAMFFISAVVTIEQIILSIAMGFAVYTAMFYIFKAKVNNPLQYHSVIRFKMIYYIGINAILGMFLLILYLCIHSEYDEEYYNENAILQFKRLDSKVNVYTLSEGTFGNIVCFLGNIAMFIGMKIEYSFTYNNNYNYWRTHTFEMVSHMSESDLNQSMYSINEKYFTGSQWNHTGKTKAVWRFFFVVLFGLIGILPYVFVQYVFKWKTNNYVFLVLAVFVPIFYLCFGMFYLFKFFFRKLKLANHSNNSIKGIK